MEIETKRGDIAELSTDLNVITAEINAYQRVAGEAIFEIGRRLHHVKYNPSEYGLPIGKDKEGREIVARGSWGEWLLKMDIPERQAQRFIQVFDQFDKPTTSSLNSGKIFEMISLPSDVDRGEFAEKSHTIPSTGETKTVDEMTVRELREVKKALKEAEEARKLAERQRDMAERDANILRNTLESIEDRETEVEIRTEYVEVEVEKTVESEDTRPYGVKLGDEIYSAFDELSQWQKKYSWIITDRDEFKMLADTNPDFAREFNRLDKFWRQLSNAFHSVESKGVYNSMSDDSDVIDGEFTEIL